MQRKQILRALFSLTLGLAHNSLGAASYDLFHPAPAPLRDLNTDRPDKATSAVTVDAGHWQLEMDSVSLHRDQDANTRSTGLQVADFNLRVGLTQASELELNFDPWDTRTDEDLASGQQMSVSGNGDLVARLKLNFWGDDGGPSSFGLIPFIKAPTAVSGLGDGALESGLIVPLGLELGAGFGLGTSLELDCNKDDAGDGYHVDSSLSASVDHDLAHGLGAYLELWGLISGQQSVDARPPLKTSTPFLA